jgi:hypothetical protein
MQTVKNVANVVIMLVLIAFIINSLVRIALVLLQSNAVT